MKTLEELGFEKRTEDLNTINFIYVGKELGLEYLEITFNVREKEIILYQDYEYTMHLPFELIKAISLKIEETKISYIEQ